MPVNSHLRWVEIKEFSPGLWENGDWLMPASAAQTMHNIFPQPGGGMRAFYGASRTHNVTGITDYDHERVIGLHARGGIPARSGTPVDLLDRYLVTYHNNGGTNLRPRLYRMDGTAGETSWAQIYRTSGTNEWNTATSNNDSPRKASFRFFRLSSGSPNDQYLILVVRYVATNPNGPGIWRLNYNDSFSAQKAIQLTTSVTDATYPEGAIAVHQARVMVSSGQGTVGERLVWSDPGTVTFGAANFLDVEPNQDLPDFIAMHPNPPSDLIIAKEGAPFVTIQGDITDPVVQSMGEGLHPGGTGEQDFARTPEGLAFIATDGSVYLTNGYEFTNLSSQLGSFGPQSDFVGPGDTNYINEFLFGPNGYVFDFRTRSWFTQDTMAGALHNVERYSRTIWGPSDTGAGNYNIRSIHPFEDASDANRHDTWTWKSAPIRSEDGRQVQIREVQVYCKTYASNSEITCTVNGTAKSITVASAGRHQLSFLFSERAEVLDVQLDGDTAVNTQEGPSIESVRIGFTEGHLLAHG